MRILVPVRQVPDPTVVAFEHDGTLQPNVGLIVNDYDGYAIEAAIQLRESGAAEEVVVVSVGPGSVKDALTRALAMGADRGLHLLTDAPLDALAVTRLLADEARAGSFDLVLAGQETSDGASGTVGPMLAGLLGWPLVTNVVGLRVADAALALEREIEDGRQQVHASLPAVLCALTGLNEPRYPSLKGIMAARKKPLEVREIDGEALPRTVRWGTPYAEERPAAGEFVVVEQLGLDEAVRRAVALLDERRLIPRGG